MKDWQHIRSEVERLTILISQGLKEGEAIDLLHQQLCELRAKQYGFGVIPDLSSPIGGHKR